MSVDPEGEVAIHGEDERKEAQEVEGGAGRRQVCSCRVRGGSEDFDPIQGVMEANPLNYVLLSVGGKVRVDNNGG